MLVASVLPPKPTSMQAKSISFSWKYFNPITVRVSKKEVRITPSLRFFSTKEMKVSEPVRHKKEDENYKKRKVIPL
jgi:hypothetical protein